MYSYGPPHMAVQKQDDQHEHTFSNYVRIRDVVQKTCLGRWTIGRSGERGSGISVLPARYDDDDDDVLWVYNTDWWNEEHLEQLLRANPVREWWITKTTFFFFLTRTLFLRNCCSFSLVLIFKNAIEILLQFTSENA